MTKPIDCREVCPNRSARNCLACTAEIAAEHLGGLLVQENPGGELGFHGLQLVPEPKAYTDEIQPTMVRTVAWMQSHGFKTCDSGDGVLNVEAGMEGALDFPHVFAQVPPPEMVALATWLRILADVEGIGGKVECSYSPDDGVAMVALYGVTDADWKERP